MLLSVKGYSQKDTNSNIVCGISEKYLFCDYGGFIKKDMENYTIALHLGYPLDNKKLICLTFLHKLKKEINFGNRLYY